MTNQVIITVYITNKNYGKYLNKSIQSVTNQSFKNYEIIIIHYNPYRQGFYEREYSKSDRR